MDRFHSSNSQFKTRLLSNEYRMDKFQGAETINPPEVGVVVGNHGFVLRISNTGVALHIPPNAFHIEDEKHNVTLRILPHTFFNESSFEDLSTVVVEILPNKLTLLEDAKLTLPHCLEIQSPEEFRVQVFQSHHDPGTKPLWKDISQSVSYTLGKSFCDIFLKSFACVKYKLSTGKTVKGKKIVVYATGDVPTTFQDHKRNHARIDVGYYPHLPGEDKHKKARTVTRRKENDSRVVTDSTCFDISRKLFARDWKIVGRCLDLDENVIDRVSADNPNNVREMAHQMLITWKGIKGQEASYKVLEKALRKAERVDLADIVSTL